MSEVKDIWEKGASFYDQFYTNNIIYHRSHEVIIDLLPKKEKLQVLDLGAGTGILAEKILKKIPESSITCIDFSANMITECKRRLEPFKTRAEFVIKNIATWTPPHNYDVIVTCNALVYKEINLEEIYSKYATVLNADGLFLNSTVIKHGETLLQEKFMSNLIVDGASWSKEAKKFIEEGSGKKINHFGKDSLAVAFSIEEHLKLMTVAGLKSLCPWRYLSVAVLMGIKNINK
jgi:2-polyprenyl-3-methyl-5-hydroxy-6-metoxy-1,4-benzoquinol methylase